MRTRRVLLLSCLVCGSFLLTGALSPQDLQGELAGAALPAQAAFVAGPVTLPDGWQAQGAVPILDSLLQTYQPGKLPWLEITLSQRSCGEEESFHAEGRLVWAAGRKVRVEWNLRGRHASTILLVSDGKTLRRSVHHESRPKDIENTKLSTNEQRSWKMLESHGCTSFHALLAELRTRGRDWKKETGHCKDLAVLRLTATLSPVENTGVQRDRADLCRVYLDARNLWPQRIEWCRRGQVLVAMDFGQPRLENNLDAETTARLFDLDK